MPVKNTRNLREGLFAPASFFPLYDVIPRGVAPPRPHVLIVIEGRHEPQAK